IKDEGKWKGQREWNTFKIDALNPPGGGDAGERAWENVIQNLKNAKKDLIQMLVRDYSEDLRFSAGAELRHLYDSKNYGELIWEGWGGDPETWAKNWSKRAQSYAQDDKSINDAVVFLKNRLRSLENADADKKEIDAVVDMIEKIKSGKKANAIEDYIKRLDEAYVTGVKDHYGKYKVQHGWNTKFGESHNAEDPFADPARSYKLQQIRLMAELVHTASPADWENIANKLKKYKHL
ncbi:unnamed protein product, partial [marine sediment metagenome]